MTVNAKFKEFAEKWLNDFARFNLKKTTFQRMKNTTIRVYAAFGHSCVDSITRGQVQAFVDDMAKNGKNMKTGKPLRRGSPYKWQREFTERHGMRFCDIHSLRHFNSTVLINAGVDTATVSSAPGHFNISTTTNIYFHAIREAPARTGEAIAAVLDFSDNKSEAG